MTVANSTLVITADPPAACRGRRAGPPPTSAVTAVVPARAAYSHSASLGTPGFADLDDAPLVGHHPGQVRREVDADGLPAAAAHEGRPGPVDQGGDLRRLGVDRQRARVDAPRVEEVADEAVHVIGLRVDDAEELPHLGRVENP